MNIEVQHIIPDDSIHYIESLHSVSIQFLEKLYIQNLRKCFNYLYEKFCLILSYTAHTNILKLISDDVKNSDIIDRVFRKLYENQNEDIMTILDVYRNPIINKKCINTYIFSIYSYAPDDVKIFFRIKNYDMIKLGLKLTKDFEIDIEKQIIEHKSIKLFIIGIDTSPELFIKLIKYYICDSTFGVNMSYENQDKIIKIMKKKENSVKFLYACSCFTNIVPYRIKPLLEGISAIQIPLDVVPNYIFIQTVVNLIPNTQFVINMFDEYNSIDKTDSLIYIIKNKKKIEHFKSYFDIKLIKNMMRRKLIKEVERLLKYVDFDNSILVYLFIINKVDINIIENFICKHLDILDIKVVKNFIYEMYLNGYIFNNLLAKLAETNDDAIYEYIYLIPRCNINSTLIKFFDNSEKIYYKVYDYIKYINNFTPSIKFIKVFMSYHLMTETIAKELYSKIDFGNMESYKEIKLMTTVYIYLEKYPELADSFTKNIRDTKADTSIVSKEPTSKMSYFYELCSIM